MKKFFLMLLCMVTMNLNAQEHLEFMGIPICGSGKAFGDSLVARGFIKVPDNSDPNVATNFLGLFRGKFWRFSDCEIRLTGDRKTDVIECVTVEQRHSSPQEFSELAGSIMKKYNIVIPPSIDKDYGSVSTTFKVKNGKIKIEYVMSAVYIYYIDFPESIKQKYDKDL